MRTIHLSVFSVIAVLFTWECQAAETISSAWSVVDVGVGKKPAFDFDAEDNIRLMAFTFDNELLYDTASSIYGSWNLQTIANFNSYGPGDLVVDHEGVSHVAVHDHGFDGGSPHHLTISATGTVTDFPIVAPGHNGWDNALAVDSAGLVHQSSNNPSGFGAADGLEFGKFNGTDWAGYGAIVGTGQAMYGYATDISTDSGNFAHMIYTKATTTTGMGDLNYVVDSAIGPTISTIVDDGISRFASIAVDAQDRPHVAWLEIDPIDTTTGSVKYGVLENGSWSIDTVDATIANINNSDGRKQVSLDLDSNDQPHISYGDQQSINYATKTDSSWNSTPVLSADENTYNGLVVLRLNSLDQPTIAFHNAANLVRLAAISVPGDFTGDGVVDGADFLSWQRGESPSPLSSDDLSAWQINYNSVASAAISTTVPEPGAGVLCLVALVLWRSVFLAPRHFSPAK